ncbi:MAG: SUMF1/EgtB/PvdO family nonheme iron enzyme [Candidatus Eisenbacteria bacterium]|nr:SUMF1/EgtB/PvdO family nonheme iron enzyme [Candidatus Eisenbacteria bacterium]
MARMRTSRSGRQLWIAAWILACAVLLGGCGEQDLYKPPKSVYEVIARVPLPSGAEDVAVLGNTAFVVAGQSGLHSVDISDPANPRYLMGIGTQKFVESLVVASIPTVLGIYDIAYTIDGTEGLLSFDVTKPDSLVRFESGGGAAVDAMGVSIEPPRVSGGMYTLYQAESWHGVRIFFADPSIPGRIAQSTAFCDTPGYARDSMPRDGWLYVADDEMGLTVIDARVPDLNSVVVTGNTDTPGFARAVDLMGDYAFVADGPNGLVVMRIHEGDKPIEVAHLALGGFARSITIRDETAFLAAQDGGVHMVDISDPTNPVLAGTVVTTYATGVACCASGAVVVSDRTEGLVILGGGGAFQDRTAPGIVEDLAAVATDSSSVRLTWNAPGDDEYLGTASAYDIRYSTGTIDDSSWDAAIECEGEPSPAVSRSAESFRVTGLQPGTTYAFALRAIDDAGNASKLSRVATSTTPSGNVPPTLLGNSVAPEAASESEAIVFRVTYEDGEGEAPAVHDVQIGGNAFPMELESGNPRDGAVYRYESTFPKGRYEHLFVFEDGHQNRVELGPFPGPFIGDVYTVGSPPGEVGRDTDETLHKVVLTRRAVLMADHEVTQAEYQAVMGTNPSRFVGSDQRPVERVSWFDAVAYCNAISARDGLEPAYTILGDQVTWNRDAEGWRLPTEAEWEIAARAGTSGAFPTGELAANSQTCGIDATLDPLGWYCGNAGGTTHEVKGKAPNPGGLYDMHGNVWEWCWDFYSVPTSQTEADPAGPEMGAQRVIRGGSWYYYARDCRSAARAPYFPNSRDDIVGFRVCRNAEE